MAWFRNHYRCGHEWTHEWSAMRDDDYNIMLQALSLHGKFVLRPPKDDGNSTTTTTPAKAGGN
jgi:hypothetical protein